MVAARPPPKRGCEQQVFDQWRGHQDLLSRAGCTSSSPAGLNTNTQKARCSVPLPTCASAFARKPISPSSLVHQDQLLVVAGDDSVIGFQVIQAALRPLANKSARRATYEAWVRRRGASHSAGLALREDGLIFNGLPSHFRIYYDFSGLSTLIHSFRLREGADVRGDR